ncbi:MAG: terminase gpA endonuclease subunit, partial [Verrucomicrobiota bacterium]
GAAQLAKTLLGIIFVVWVVLKRPGLTTWNGQTDQSIGKFAEDKAWPMFRACRRLLSLMPSDRNKQRIRSIVFPHMSLRFQAASENNAHGDTVLNQINDERHLWPAGMIHKFRSRTGSMPNSKTLDLSTGSVKYEEQELPDGSIQELGDDFFNDWMAGTRALWSVKCPGCQRVQPLAWWHRHYRAYRGEADGPIDGKELLDEKGKPAFGIVWDETEATRPGGRWNYGAVAKTARWRCRADLLGIPRVGKSKSPCSFEVCDSPDDIRALNSLESGARYVVTNPLADPSHETFRFPAMCSELVGWGTLLVEFLRALEAAKVGDYLPLKTFIQNRLGEAFDEKLTIQETSNPTGDYALGDDWFDDAGRPRWHRIFLVADVQEKKGRHYWVMVRGFTADGQSRLIFYGRLESWEAIRAKQIECAVQDGHVAIDAGDGNNFHEITDKCAEYGWIALQGRDQEFFAHPNPRNPKQPLNKLWSPKQTVDPSRGVQKRRGKKAKREEQIRQQVAAVAASIATKQGKAPKRFAKLYRWSNPGVKDILARLMSGNWKYWGRPSDEPVDYTDQLSS